MPGCIHVYTGDGKGKTTAAMGLALRAAGCGRRVAIIQFLKGGATGEIEALKALQGVTIKRNSREYGFFEYLAEKDRLELTGENNRMLVYALSMAERAECDMLVLDEAIPAYNLYALDRGILDEFIKNKPAGLELVLTGRGAPQHFIDAAQYVTDMKKLKHPFDDGIAARRGVEF